MMHRFQFLAVWPDSQLGLIPLEWFGVWWLGLGVLFGVWGGGVSFFKYWP